MLTCKGTEGCVESGGQKTFRLNSPRQIPDVNSPIALMGSPSSRILGNEVLNANLEVKGQLGMLLHCLLRPAVGGKLSGECAVSVCRLSRLP